MEKPFLSEYLKNLNSKIDLLKKMTTELRTKSTLNSLEVFRKEVHKLATDFSGFEIAKFNDLCQRLEWDIVAKIKNFYLSEPSKDWFNEVDQIINQIQESFPGGQLPQKSEPKKERKKRVIVIDDDEDLVRLLSYEFRELGFEVQTFNLGALAISYISKEENLQGVFLLIIDRMLPDMDGLEILKSFMKKSQTIPVLILSSLNTENDIISGLQEGAVDYITKPFSVFMLMQKSLNLLKTQGG